MATPFSDFGETAKGLSRNPLGIIALFIVLVYAMACLVTTASNFEAGARTPLVWFLVVFPVLVLLVFGWLVSSHHEKLYAPADYKDEQHFANSVRPKFRHLKLAVSEGQLSTEANAATEVAYFGADGWPQERESVYKACRDIFIAHVLVPSQDPKQIFDIFIYLIRHKSGDLSDVDSAEFFFGRKWGNEVFQATKEHGQLGVRTSAFGPFLCTCRVKMKDQSVLRIHRYIDFEMGNVYLGSSPNKQHPNQVQNKSNEGQR